jgi:hypothetical protein
VHVGNTAKGFRLYSPEINQPKVSALTNRVSGVNAVQATLHGPQPGYEAPLLRGLRGYGFQHMQCTEAAVLAALSGDDPNYTIVASAKRVGAGAAQAILGARDSGGAKWRLGFDSANKLTVVRDAASLTESSADAGNKQVVTLLANGTSYSLRRNGALVTSGTVNAGSLTMTSLDLLADGAQLNRLNGYATDIAIFSRALSGPEYGAVEAGFMQRIGA